MYLAMFFAVRLVIEIIQFEFNCSWQEASIDTYDALEGSFMKPAIEEASQKKT